MINSLFYLPLHFIVQIECHFSIANILYRLLSVSLCVIGSIIFALLDLRRIPDNVGIQVFENEHFDYIGNKSKTCRTPLE